ncbi:MAG: hypothetical protein NKF39_04235, partial [Tropheryma whipplei]|nr:hypothetical protein [Tropheryma whipplei]
MWLVSVDLLSFYLVIDRLERVVGWCCWRTSFDARFAAGATGCVSMVPLVLRYQVVIAVKPRVVIWR